MVILAGPGVNLLIAFVLFWVVLMSGNLDGAIALGTSTRRIAHVRRRRPSVAGDRAGRRPPAGVLRPGDRIVAVDGHAGDADRPSQADRRRTPAPARQRQRLPRAPRRCT